ncbi:hypothetical protein, partial [Escherichia coli]|uniref:hypothetical protein n=1 Tax=Escherichia coli TaxID=562 RepID=UPI0023B18E76
VQTTFGGVCGAKKGGLALHFGLESAKTVRCKKRHVNVGRIRHLLSDAMLAHLIRPTNRIESVGQIRHFRSIRHLLSDAMLAHLIRPTNRIEP